MTTRSLVRGCLAPALALTLLASAGCKRTADESREAARTGEGALDQTKRQTGEAYDQAKEAQKTAMERQDLTEAQREMQQRELEAQQAQQAQQQAQAAQQQDQAVQQKAQQDQLAREQQLQQEDKQLQQQDRSSESSRTTTDTTTTTTTASTADGTIETASQDEVVIRRAGGTTLRLDVDPQATTVMMNGKPATLTDLQSGSKVKVSYHTERGQQVATRIEVGTLTDDEG